MAALGHIVERCGRWDWCRMTRRSGAVFPTVKKSAIGGLISVVRKHTPQLPGTPGGTRTHDLTIWPHTLLLSYRSVSPAKMATRQTPAAISERVRRKKKRGYPASCWGGCLRTAPYTRRCPLVATDYRLPLRDDATLPRSFGSWTPSFL